MTVGIYCSYDDLLGGHVEESWTVPDEVSDASFSVWGADDQIGGTGGHVNAGVAVTPGEILTLTMGHDGGASVVSRGSTVLLRGGGGNGLEPNYIGPGASVIVDEAPGQSLPPYPGNGAVAVSWLQGWVEIPPWQPGPEVRPPTDEVRRQIPTERGCLVPKVVGKAIKFARIRLAKANCSVGHLRRRSTSDGRVGKVVKQWPKSGALLAGAGEVDLTVGARKAVVDNVEP